MASAFTEQWRGGQQSASLPQASRSLPQEAGCGQAHAGGEGAEPSGHVFAQRSAGSWEGGRQPVAEATSSLSQHLRSPPLAGVDGKRPAQHDLPAGRMKPFATQVAGAETFPAVAFVGVDDWEAQPNRAMERASMPASNMRRMRR